MPGSDIVAAVIGVVALYVLFRVIQTEWPNSYYSVTDLHRYETSTTPLRYALFRFGPVGLATFFVSGLAFRDGRNGWLPGSLLVTLHVLLTVGKAVVEGRLWRQVKKPYLWTLIFIAIGAIAVGLMGSFMATFPATWSALPTFRDASTDLWTALFAGLVAAFFIRATNRSGPDIDQVVAAAERRLGKSLLDHAWRTALEHGTDPLFVRAIMITESLQRPRWWRNLERRFGPRLGAQSYGVMQVPKSQPMTDEMSVVEAVRGYFPGFQVAFSERSGPDTDAVRAAAVGYNPSGNYGDLVVEVYLTLWYRQQASSNPRSL